MQEVLDNNKLDSIEKLWWAMDEAAATELGLEGQSHQGSWIQQFQKDDQDTYGLPTMVQT